MPAGPVPVGKSMQSFLVNYRDQRSLEHPDVRIQARNSGAACDLIGQRFGIDPGQLVAVPLTKCVDLTDAELEARLAQLRA